MVAAGRAAVGGGAGQHGARVIAVVVEVVITLRVEPLIGWWQRR